MTRQWFRIENKAETPNIAEIQIIDIIGSWDDDWFARNFGYDLGITARVFVEQLAQLPDAVDTLRVHINSPGGDVQAGINIANALRTQQTAKGRTVETYIDGIAASIAAVIALAGSKVFIADNALVMVHNPWGGAVGDAAEMRKVADILDTMRGQIVATYQWHSSMSAEDLAVLMDAETWMNADEAIAAGFATEKVAGLQAVAAIDPRAVAKLKVPDRYKARVEALLKPAAAPPAAASAVDILSACETAGCPELAKALITEGATLEQATARITATTATKAAATARATEITALCQAAKQTTLAQGYITGGMAVADVKAHLTTISALVDDARGHIDPALKPKDANSQTSAAALPTAASIYAARKNRTTKKES